MVCSVYEGKHKQVGHWRMVVIDNPVQEKTGNKQYFFLQSLQLCIQMK